MKKLQVFDKIAFFRADDDCSLLLGGKGSYKKINEHFDDIYFLPQLQGYQVAGGQNGFVAFTNFENLKIFYESKLVYDKNSMSYLANCKDTFLVENEVVSRIVFFDVKENNFGETAIKHWGKNYFSNDFLFVSQKEHIISYSLQNFHPLWQYTLPEAEYSQGSNYPPAVSKEIASILGVYANTLWIVSDMGHLIGIKSETGECKYHLKTPINLPAEWGNWEVFINAKKSFIDTEKGIIFGLDYPNYWECDLNNPTQTYLLYNISATSQEHNIVPDFQGNWLGDEVFFGQNSFAKDPTHIGVFNRQTKEIRWTSHELGEAGTFAGLQKIEYADGRLYVLDRASTLHIFERETHA